MSTGRFNVPESVAMRPRRQIPAGDAVARPEHVEHVLMPVGESTPNALDAETNAGDATPLGNFRARRPMRDKILGIDAVNQAEISCVPDLVEPVNERNIVQHGLRSNRQASATDPSNVGDRRSPGKF
jgi:hypothetical protein